MPTLSEKQFAQAVIAGINKDKHSRDLRQAGHSCLSIDFKESGFYPSNTVGNASDTSCCPGPGSMQLRQQYSAPE